MKIAISGLSGCGNTTATKNVANEMNYVPLNYTFRTLADQLQIPFEDLHKISQKTPFFDYLVDLETLKLSKKDGVVVGSRLSAWLLDADLKIWLSASVEERTRRILNREPEKYHHSFEIAFAKTSQRDQENRRRYLEFYGIDLNMHDEFDLIINTEQLTADQVSSLISAAARWAHQNHLKRPNYHRERLIKIITSQLGPASVEYLNDPESSIADLYQTLKIHFPYDL